MWIAPEILDTRLGRLWRPAFVLLSGPTNDRAYYLKLTIEKSLFYFLIFSIVSLRIASPGKMRFEVVTGAAAFVALVVAHQQDVPVQDAREFAGWSQDELDAKWGMDVRHCI